MIETKLSAADPTASDRILVAGTGLMLLCALATIAWGADRSLGLTDEGVYLLAARYPEEIRQNVSSVYIYTGFLFRLVGFSPVGFRLLGAGLVAGSTAVLWFGFIRISEMVSRHVRTARYFRWYSLFLIELGALLLYQWFYLTPNYNTLVAIAVNLSAGAFLTGLARSIGRDTRWQRAARPFAAAGFATGFAFFVKFPAGICILASYLAALILWSGLRGLDRIRLAAALTAGVAAWLCVHFLLIQPPAQWWHLLVEGWTLYQTIGTYAPEAKSAAYLTEGAEFVLSSIRAFWPSYAALAVLFLTFRLTAFGRRNSQLLAFAGCSLAMLWAVFISWEPGFVIGARVSAHGSIPFYLVFHLAWIVLVVSMRLFVGGLGSVPGEWLPKRNAVVVIVLLVALPIAASAGTQNPLYNVPLCHAATWMAAILLTLVSLSGQIFKGATARAFGLLSVGLFTVSQITQGYLLAPQLVPTPLLRQTQPTQVGYPPTTLKLDPDTHRLFDSLSTIARKGGFRRGEDLIALSFLPGVVYAMGGRSPGHPTFLAGSPGNDAYTRMALRFASTERLRRAFVLLNVEPAQVQSLLRERGLHFPERYEMVGSATQYAVQYTIWKPKERIQ